MRGPPGKRNWSGEDAQGILVAPGGANEVDGVGCWLVPDADAESELPSIAERIEYSRFAASEPSGNEAGENEENIESGAM